MLSIQEVRSRLGHPKPEQKANKGENRTLSLSFLDRLSHYRRSRKYFLLYRITRARLQVSEYQCVGRRMTHEALP